MGPSRRSHQHGPPLLGRVQVSPCSPTSSLVCSPPTPCPHQPRLRFPLPVAYLDAGACSVPMGADDTCARHVPCVGDGSPALRSTGVSSRRGEGLPGYGAILFVRAMVEHPAGYVPLLAHVAQRTLWPSGKSAPWASGKVRGFGAACPMAHTFACLRIAGVISGTGARLATGSGGLTLGRAGFAPAGRRTKFHEGLVSSLPFDQHCLVALIFLYSLLIMDCVSIACCFLYACSGNP
jgi:hypothetical protein